jgi:HD-GYP domain-containing protein (c-di-GMP phosphodiesterase class II)
MQPHASVVLFTGEPNLDTATEALRLGAFDYLPKPVRKDALCRVVERAAQVASLRLANIRLDQENRLHREELQRLVEDRTRELEVSIRSLARVQVSTSEALALALEMRDPYTAGHQRRVTALACAIWDRLGLGADGRDGLRIAGMLHDLGKLKIPADILTKPTRLSRAEFELVKEHPLAAWEILRVLDFPWPVADIVRQHHERVDGSGYPDGLGLDAIRTEARVLGVADVVEAMASHRPYRAALGIGAALEEIRAGRGARYCPDTVDACIAVFLEDGFVLPNAT